MPKGMGYGKKDVHAQGKQGKGGSKKSHFEGGESQVKKPMGKKADTTTTGGNSGKAGPFKAIGSTRTPYNKQTPGCG